MAKKNKQSSAVAKAMEEFITPAEQAEHEARVTKKERPKDLETVVDSASWWKFSETSIFEGHFVDKFLALKDDKNRQVKKGDVTGYRFIEDGTDKEYVLPKNHSITEALEKDGFKTTTLWWIEFEGKVQREGRNPFNRFYIGKRKPKN